MANERIDVRAPRFWSLYTLFYWVPKRWSQYELVRVRQVLATRVTVFGRVVGYYRKHW